MPETNESEEIATYQILIVVGGQFTRVAAELTVNEALAQAVKYEKEGVEFRVERMQSFN